MIKTIRIFVFLFTVFAVYFSLEQLAFGNTIFASSKTLCCNNAGYCNDKECSAQYSVKYYASPGVCDNEEPYSISCAKCLQQMSDGYYT